jgi:hypothetical protein
MGRSQAKANKYGDRLQRALDASLFESLKVQISPGDQQAVKALSRPFI